MLSIRSSIHLGVVWTDQYRENLSIDYDIVALFHPFQPGYYYWFVAPFSGSHYGQGSLYDLVA
jgi:hypothetical protein